jgi:hypothetical protein
LEKNLAAIPPEQEFNRLGLELRLHQLRAMKVWLVECRKTLDIHLPRRKI